jgi:CRP/FNR family cyclic AMP-dependent transcriptional regulator
MADSERETQKLGPSMLTELSKHGVARIFRERTVLVTEGEKTDALYIILEGRVRAYVSDAAGREAVLSIMGPGEYFGEIALINESPRTATLTARTDMLCYGMTPWDFRPLVETNSTIAWKLLTAMAEKMR